MKEDVIGNYGIPGEQDSDRITLWMFVYVGLIAGKDYFQHKDIQRYNWPRFKENNAKEY